MRNLNCPSTLCGYWKINGNANDYSGNGNNGTWVGDESYVKNQFGKQAGEFDGVGDLINVGPVNPSTTLTSELSLSAWVRTTSATQQAIIAVHPNGNHKIEFKVQNNKARIHIFNGVDDIYAESSKIVNDGNWHHITGTIDFDSQLNIYVDGIYNGTTTSNQAITEISAADWKIGSNDGTDKFFDGGISEVRIYNIALTDSEIKELYKQTYPEMKATSQPISQKEPYDNGNLVSAWGFNNQLGFKDSVGSNDGTNNGAILTKDGGFELNGSSEGIIIQEAGNADLIGGASGSTIVGWYNFSGSSDGIIYEDAFNGDLSRSRLTILSDGKIELKARSNAGESFDSFITSTAVSKNAWHHVAGVTDLVGDIMKIYVDGVNVSTTGTFDLEDDVFDTDSSMNTYLGTKSSAAEYFAGGIKEVQIHDAVLTADEVKSIYQQGVPDDSLKLHVLDGAEDLSKNDNQLTNIGTKIGKEMDFNGTSDYIDTEKTMTEIGWKTDEPLSISAWVKSAGDTGTHQYIIDNFNYGWLFYIVGTSGKINITNYPSSGNYSINSSDDSVLDGRWHHIFATMFPNNNTPILYLDGVEQTNPQSLGNVTQIGDTDKDIMIGRRSSTADRWFNGSIKNLNVYKEAKSADFIKNEYDKEKIYF